MKARLSLLFLLLACQSGIAQVIPDHSHIKTIDGKLSFLSAVCDSLYNIEKYNDELQVARYALSITPKTDYYNISRFQFFIGVTYEFKASLDTAVTYYTLSKENALKSKDSKRIRNALNRLVIVYSNQINGEKPLKAAITETLRFIDTTKNEKEKVALYATVARYYNKTGEYETQVSYLIKGIEGIKQMLKKGTITDPEAVVVDLVNLAELYLEQKKADKALEYLLDSRPFILTTVDYINYYYRRMTDVYLLKADLPSARIYYDSLMILSKKHPENVSVQVNVMTENLAFADYFMEKNELKSAYDYTNRANKVDKKYITQYEQAELDLMNGKMLVAGKEFQKALPFLQAALPLRYELGPQLYVTLLEVTSKCYANLNRWQEAYKLLESYIPIRDSLYTESSKKSIADAEAQYKNKEKQQEIELKNVQISESDKQRIWLVGGLLLTGFSIVLLTIIYRNKRASAEQLDNKNQELAKLVDKLEEANQTKAKLMGIISHDLRTPINQVFLFLKLQQSNPHLLSEKQKEELSSKIQAATGSLLETMEGLLFWSKSQMSQFKTDIQPTELKLVLDQSIQLLQLDLDAKKVNVSNEVDASIFVQSDPYYLQTIVRNLIQNAIKVSPENGVIELTSVENTEETILYIQNSGNAFTQEQYHQMLASTENGMSGFGLKLVDELSRKIGTKIGFENPEPNCTRVSLHFVKKSLTAQVPERIH